MNNRFFKYSIFTLTLIFLIYCISEIVSFALLSVATTVQERDWGLESKITQKFPAQLRMTTEEILEDFPSISVIPRAGQFLSFDFDPALGYRRLGNQRWYGGSLDELDDKFLIVCFGGSTTQLDNWPKYLLKYIKASGIKTDVVVLNAGLSGYMTFNEKLYFSDWILPMLAQAGKKPDLVLSLDGANDIWYRIFSYYLAQEDGARWLDRYHGFHQHHDQDMRRIRTVAGAAHQLLANSLSAFRIGAIRLAPYSMRLLEYLLRSFVVRDGGPGSNSDAVPTVTLPRVVETRIVNSFGDSLTDFYALAAARNIGFVAYLQPVVLHEYYPYQIPEEYPFKGIDWMGLKEHRANSLFTRLTVDKLVSTRAMFQDAEVMYGNLNSEFPTHFQSLISLFSNISDVKGLYKNDSIHYNLLGKETIAKAVVEDLITKGLLPKE